MLFREITAKLNECFKQRLGQSAFDQIQHVDKVLGTRSGQFVTNERGRQHLIKEIIQCLLVITQFDNYSKQYRFRLNSLLMMNENQILKQFYENSRFYQTIKSGYKQLRSLSTSIVQKQLPKEEPYAMTVPSQTKDFESSHKKSRKNFTFKLELMDTIPFEEQHQEMRQENLFCNEQSDEK